MQMEYYLRIPLKMVTKVGFQSLFGKKEDEVDLCSDGTFESRITRTGIFKGQAKKYQGKKSGKWEVQSNGEKAMLKFTFEKLDPVEIELVAKDEEIYIRGARYFVGESERCMNAK